jgi:hypothetical protein
MISSWELITGRSWCTTVGLSQEEVGDERMRESMYGDEGRTGMMGTRERVDASGKQRNVESEMEVGGV